MKTLSITLFAIFLSSHLIMAQNEPLLTEVNVSNYELPEIKRSSRTSVLHATYLKKTKEINMSKHIQNLRKYVSNYDYRKNENFDVLSQTSEVKFQSEKGYILVTYDVNGKIIKTEEVFKDVKIPLRVRQTVFYVYPGWILTKVKYHSQYMENQPNTTFYKVEIQKGDETKSIKVNSKGEFL
ncbi:hypothetical protein LRR18_13950 [Mangrovimonas sp. AS39]|uniref:hypothetical protein n=1 Tax=Mangrovimonas TaxID=1211036 RepID=UPI0006B67610|nr:MULTISPECIES: hypothetical protein [Mangrovimonas]MCF1192695.1 hypothetical protein [Mangrovimonas futianensis]MCF1196384.1 hypothetical protein [Mangrovimonas futianensis]NIK92122.1 hypothetical protein [Mangrovimonas sp. CR14]